MKISDLCLILRKIKSEVDALLVAISANETLLPDESLCAIKEYIADRLQVVPESRTPAAAIRGDFIMWCHHNHPKIILPSQKRLGAALREAGFHKRKCAGKIEYINARLSAGLDLPALDSTE